jgi:hypothetical protein
MTILFILPALNKISLLMRSQKATAYAAFLSNCNIPGFHFLQSKPTNKILKEHLVQDDHKIGADFGILFRHQYNNV